MKTKFSGRNVALMVAPVALAMGIVLMAPLVADHLEKNHDRLDHIRAGRKELYNARLQPCPDGTEDPRVVAIVTKPGELDVAIFRRFLRLRVSISPALRYPDLAEQKVCPTHRLLRHRQASWAMLPIHQRKQRRS